MKNTLKQALTEKQASALDSCQQPPDPAERAYLDRVIALYDKAVGAEEGAALTPDEASAFQMTLFDEMMKFRLGRPDKAIAEIRLATADQFRKAGEMLSEKGVKVDELIDRVNALTKEFQNQVANSLSAEEYRAFLGLEPGVTVVLGDIEIARKAYEDIL